ESIVESLNGIVQQREVACTVAIVGGDVVGGQVNHLESQLAQACRSTAGFAVVEIVGIAFFKEGVVAEAGDIDLLVPKATGWAVFEAKIGRSIRCWIGATFGVSNESTFAVGIVADVTAIAMCEITGSAIRGLER